MRGKQNQGSPASDRSADRADAERRHALSRREVANAPATAARADSLAWSSSGVIIWNSFSKK